MPGLLVRTSGWGGQGDPDCFGKPPRLISERGCKGFGDGEIGQGEGGLAWGEGRGRSSDLWQKRASHDAGQESVAVGCESLPVICTGYVMIRAGQLFLAMTANRVLQSCQEFCLLHVPEALPAFAQHQAQAAAHRVYPDI